MHRTTLGDFEISIISDGTYYLDGGALFGVVPKILWERRIKPDEKNRVLAGLNSLLIRTGHYNVLVETGIGDKLDDKKRKIYASQALLLDNLAAAGVAPEDIDIVINTHLHFDHCGWNTVRKGGKLAATFPKARYYAQEAEWRHASRQHERDRVSYLSENYDPLISSGQMRLLHGDDAIVPGVSVKIFPGHTQNMQAVMVRSGGKKACYISDLIPTSHHLDLTWVMAYDLFPLETIESRKRFYADAIPQQWLVVYTHDHEMPWSYVETGANGKPVAKKLA
jgi:glyoxylase-like metal-dependent hydrolase (beta-lactamase superfamily II)